MDEEKKIMEKRSSFRGWKERHKGKSRQNRVIIGIVIIVSIFLALMVYPYFGKMGDNNSIPVEKQNKTPYSTPIKQQNKTISPTPIKQQTPQQTPSPTTVKNIKTNLTNMSKNNTIGKIGKIGVPLVSNGLEITVKRVVQAELHTDAWIYVRNIDNEEKVFKFSGSVVIDNIGQQYENIKVARSAEIAQTNLYAGAMREGAIFFERLKEGRSPKKLILNVNNEKIEFILK